MSPTPVLASMSRVRSENGSPRVSEMRPPASVTSSDPAVMSHEDKSNSQNPCKCIQCNACQAVARPARRGGQSLTVRRPHATQLKCSAADPKDRTERHTSATAPAPPSMVSAMSFFRPVPKASSACAMLFSDWLTAMGESLQNAPPPRDAENVSPRNGSKITPTTTCAFGRGR